MGKKLTWDEIKKQYNQEWVLLNDYDWPEEEEYPRAGVVHIHAGRRSDFDKLIAAMEQGFNSAVIFVGEPQTRSDVVTTRGQSRVEFGVQ